KGLGYSAVPPPHPLIYNRPKKLDLSYSSIDEFKEPKFKGYGPENSEQESNVVSDKKSENSKENYEESLVEEQVSQDISRPVNTAHPKSAVYSAKSKSHFSKQAQSTAQRAFYKQTTLTRRPRVVNTGRSYTGQVSAVRVKGGKPQQDDKGFVDSGCSRHMTGNIAYLLDFKKFDKGYVTFGGGAHGGRISGKGTLKTASQN
ncbi:hypothetical protein Tco_0329216, partial [Tanacetum coccineum]